MTDYEVGYLQGVEDLADKILHLIFVTDYGISVEELERFVEHEKSYQYGEEVNGTPVDGV